MLAAVPSAWPYSRSHQVPLTRPTPPLGLAATCCSTTDTPRQLHPHPACFLLPLTSSTICAALSPSCTLLSSRASRHPPPHCADRLGRLSSALPSVPPAMSTRTVCRAHRADSGLALLARPNLFLASKRQWPVGRWPCMYRTAHMLLYLLHTRGPARQPGGPTTCVQHVFAAHMHPTASLSMIHHVAIPQPGSAVRGLLRLV